MAVVPRKNKGKVVYRVAVLYRGKQYWEPAGNDRREAERLAHALYRPRAAKAPEPAN